MGKDRARASRADPLSDAPAGKSNRARGPSPLPSLEAVLRSEGKPLEADVRSAVEPSFEHDFTQVRVHADGEAAAAARDLDAAAFTVGDHIAFGAGRYQPRTPPGRQLLAHELTHVVQQRSGPVSGIPLADGISVSEPSDSFERQARTTADRMLADRHGPGRSSARDPYRATAAHARLPARGAAGQGPLPVRGIVVQRDKAGNFKTADGAFDVDLKTRLDALTGKGTSGLDVKIKFKADKKAPYTNKLGLIQIVKDTDEKGANVNISSLPATTGPKIRTQEDKKAGVEGGFFTDVLHQDFTAAGPFNVHKQGDALLPYYQGGIPIFGYRRSDEDRDIKAAEITDAPGSAADHRDFSFETVAKGDDNQLVYGALKWGFGVRKGKVINETVSPNDAASTTFAAAIEKHRDFYVHEPVTLYFDFDHDDLAAGEGPKVVGVVPYLNRFPDVRISLTGFADQRGSAAYNLALAQRRTDTVSAALVAAGVDVGRVDVQPPVGRTTQFTTDAVPNTPANQDRDPNRRGNRRVMMEFRHVAAAPAPAPVPAPAPAPAPGPAPAAP